MNIGIFTDTFYPQISGVDTMVRTLADGLRGMGHRVVIFTTTDPGCKEKMFDVYRLPSVPFVFLPSRRVAYVVPPKLLARMKSFELDIVHTQTEFSMGIFGHIAASLMHIPQLHTYHTVYENYTHYMAGGRLMSQSMARSMSRMFCNSAASVTTPTDKTRELLESYGVTKPIHVVPTGISFKQFRRGQYSDADINSAKAEMGLNLDDPILITIGRVAKEKSMDVIIKAMPSILKQVPNLKYVSVGDGPYITELQTLAESLGVASSVIFAGPRSWETIGKYYQLGDLFVSASTTETQGIVYVEAMAAQVPLIVRRDRSVEDILIEGRTGLFFDDADELACKASKLILNREELRRLSDNAYNHVQNLSSELFVERMLEIYNGLAKSSTHREARLKKLMSKLRDIGKNKK